MLSLKDLKEFDVKNIDPVKLLRQLQQRKDFLLNCAIIIITLFSVAKIYENRAGKTRMLTSKVAELDKKVKAVADYEKAKTDLKNLTDKLPSGLSKTDNIIDKINILAIGRGIQISSFTPGTSTDMGHYIKTSLKLTVATSSYETLGQFVRDIESSAFNLRIERWSAGMQVVGQQRGKAAIIADASNAPINSDMEINSITFIK